MTIPVEVADISAAWLQDVLEPHAPGVRLDGIAIVDAHSGTTGRARVAVGVGHRVLPLPDLRVDLRHALEGR